MSWYDDIPKVELHVHLEGAIPLPALWTRLQKHGGDPDVPDIAALERRFAYTDFWHFLDVWNWKTAFLRDADDFETIAEAVARDLVRQNVVYAEMFFSPSAHVPYGLSVQACATAVRAGFDRVPEIEISLINDIPRLLEPFDEERHLRELAEVRDQGVIGVGLGGDEEVPAARFAEVFALADALGFRRTAHAGEACGADSIWGALEHLGAERIGHGTRACEDPRLVEHLAKERIPLEMCPISNLRTGVVQDLAEHPVRRYHEAGLLVTVNSDDPAMFGTSLAQEYRALVEVLGMSREGVQTLIRNAAQASWLDEEGKARVLGRLG